MSQDLTTQAVRLALGLNQLRAECASRNIAAASSPGGRTERLDFARSQGILAQVAADPADANGRLSQAIARAVHDPGVRTSDVASGGINLDEQVADMASATLEFQALSESLNRHFGLMRLAISGRS